MALIKPHSSIWPLSFASGSVTGLKGERSINTAPTIIARPTITDNTLAIRRDSNRYTVPWANGAPPSNAPKIYHNLKLSGMYPATACMLSVIVPAP